VFFHTYKNYCNFFLQTCTLYIYVHPLLSFISISREICLEVNVVGVTTARSSLKDGAVSGTRRKLIAKLNAEHSYARCYRRDAHSRRENFCTLNVHALHASKFDGHPLCLARDCSSCNHSMKSMMLIKTSMLDHSRLGACSRQTRSALRTRALSRDQGHQGSQCSTRSSPRLIKIKQTQRCSS